VGSVGAAATRDVEPGRAGRLAEVVPEGESNPKITPGLSRRHLPFCYSGLPAAREGVEPPPPR
jgi:hypothetical protein